MGRWIGYAAVGLAILVGACLLLWEAIQPVTAIRFMLILHKLDLRVAALLAPFVLTSLGLSLGVASTLRARFQATWVGFLIADIVAPIIALGGHSIVVALVGIPST